jgi:putative membrane protein
MMGFWWFGLIAILVVLWAVFRERDAMPHTPGRDRGEEVLRERFARGEIDDEEYRRKLAELRR